MTYGSSKQAKAHREVEHQRIKESNEPDVVLDELARLEAMGGDNVGSAHDALELYIGMAFNSHKKEDYDGGFYEVRNSWMFSG